MKNKEKELYLEQKNNCLLALLLSIVFIVGVTIKTISNSDNLLISLKETIMLIIPVLFLNTTFMTLLQIYKNTLIDKTVFTKRNNILLNMLGFIIMLFFISIVIIINKDTMQNNNILCLFFISVNFLYSSVLIKKIFNYEMEKRK